MTWQPPETAPKDTSVIVMFYGGLVGIARERYGKIGEPQQNEFAWRCDCCGRFAHKIKGWMPKPE